MKRILSAAFLLLGASRLVAQDAIQDT